jgi:class 3 adenylate cyclase/ligand-binding sensor domain-containing protein
MHRLSLLFVAFTSLAVTAQRHYFENITSADDLPASKVYDVRQDSTGLVWLGTDGGLASFDGVNVVPFGPNTGIASGGVRSLQIDAQKRVWCGHLGGGLSVSEGRRFRALTLTGEPLTADVTAIAQDGSGAMWLGTFGAGAIRLKEVRLDGPVECERFTAGNGPGERITGITLRADGDLVFLEAGVGLHLWSHKDGRFRDLPIPGLLDQQGVTSYFEDDHGGIWVGTQDQGAFHHDPITKRTVVYDLAAGMPSNFVYAFGQDGTGHIWIGTWDAGLVRVEKDGLRPFNRGNGAHSKTIRAITRDREGNLLIATHDEGLDIFKGDRFLQFSDDDGLVERHVWAVAEAADGRVWFGTNGGITILDPASSGPMGRQQLSVQGGDLTSNTVRCLLPDGDRVWIGTDGGLLEGTTDGGRPRSYFEDLLAVLAENKVTALGKGPGGDLLVGSINGLIRWRPGGVPTVLRTAEGLGGNSVTAIHTDKQGTIWVGTASSGVSRISKALPDKATRIDLGEVVTPSCFTTDSEGRMWVGTQSQGIVVLKDGRVVQRYDIGSGLLSNSIRSLITDDNGHVWIGTNVGLNELHKGGTTFLAYTGRSGFTGIEVSPGAVCSTRAGDLWFGTAHGANLVMIDHGTDRAEVPLIAVRVLKVNLEERDAIDGVDLSHTERDVRIEFGCVSLSDQGAVRYQYMLEGLERDWQPITPETDAHYPGLAPGNYVFMVKARNRSGVWSEPVRYHFTVLPPWYRTWWFYTMLAITIGTVVLSYIKFRERQLRLRNVVLEQRVQERTAEVVAQAREIEGQKVQIEDLLLNILPREVSEELKVKGRATARRHEQVTVMFTDMKGFTMAAEKMTPEELVNELDECFIHFDEIIGRYGLEKIKTIGDSYMCAGGVPTSDPWHAHKAVLAALEVRELMNHWAADRIKQGKIPWRLRIGVHTGPVVAGVVGKRKFAYDIWGDTVNTASRMESSGEAGEVNVSGATHALIKDRFECQARGQVEAKNKGRIDMYFVKRIHREFSADADGVRPNARFAAEIGVGEVISA